MDAPSMTVNQIDTQISTARERLSQLQNEARELSLPAVSGDADAVASLAQTNAETDRVLADLVILDHARSEAVQLQAKLDAVAHAGYRARHMAVAQDRAAAIVKLAARTDELLAEFKKVFGDLRATESEIRNALRKAGAPPDDGVVGQRGIEVFAIDALTAFTSGTDRFRQPRSIATLARAAWKHLLKVDDVRTKLHV